jgi:hypothetical protein
MQGLVLELDVGELSDVSNKERFDGLDARAAAIEARLIGVEGQLGIAIPVRNNFLTKAYKAVINHKGTAAIISVIAILGGIFGSNLYRRHLEHQDRDFNYAVDGRISTKLEPIGTKLDGLTQRMATVEGKLDVLILQRLAAGPHTSQNSKQVAEVLEGIKKSGNQVGPSVISDTGKRFIDAAKNNSDAWDAALAFLGYRTFLNAADVPAVSNVSNTSPHIEVPSTLPMQFIRAPDAGPFHWVTFFDNGPIKPGTNAHISSTLQDPVLPSMAAHFERIGQKLNEGAPLNPVAPRWIIVDGHNEAFIRLDNEWLRNVTIKNTRIVYMGGPIQLENVYFIDCTFDMQITNRAVDLARKILDSPSVTIGKA